MKWVRRQIGWIAGIAIGCFILWLIAEVLSMRTMRAEPVGILFGRKVTPQIFSQSLQAATHQAILNHGDKFRQQVKPEELEQTAWERLILLTEARRRRIRASDQEVIQEITSQPLFQINGQFDPRGYEALIQYSLGTTARTFEEETRENILIQKLFQQIVAKVSVTDQEIQKAFGEKETSIRVSYLRLPQQPIAREIAEAARQQPEQLAGIARQLSRKLVTTDFFKGSGSVPELGLAQYTFGPVFSMEPGAVAGPLPVYSGRENSDKKKEENWLVVKLEAKQPAPQEKFNEVKESLEKAVLIQKRFETYLSWYQGLLTQAKLKKIQHPIRMPTLQ